MTRIAGAGGLNAPTPEVTREAMPTLTERKPNWQPQKQSNPTKREPNWQPQEQQEEATS